MVIDFDGVACGLIEPPAPRTHLAFDARADIGRPIQISGDLQRGDPGLMVGQPPDAPKRLKQTDEIQIGDVRMEHFQIERGALGPVPIDDRWVEERKHGAKTGGPKDGIERLDSAITKLDTVFSKARNADAR